MMPRLGLHGRARPPGVPNRWSVYLKIEAKSLEFPQAPYLLLSLFWGWICLLCYKWWILLLGRLVFLSVLINSCWSHTHTHKWWFLMQNALSQSPSHFIIVFDTKTPMHSKCYEICKWFECATSTSLPDKLHEVYHVKCMNNNCEEQKRGIQCFRPLNVIWTSQEVLVKGFSMNIICTMIPQLSKLSIFQFGNNSNH